MAGEDRVRDSTKTGSNGVLCITEKWVREHLNLQKDALDDVRSISLPGSYYEKITHLGRSLVGFVRLKHLDLSRNALESLEGLEHLKHLESLNIYFNNIGSLTELFRLRHNKKLKDLDLRLNPVTKNETDYRLFMIHMLVNLRKLDDRGVRDTERRAALLHFNSDQAHLFDRSPPPSSTPVASSHSGKHLSSRKELVKALAPRPSCLDNDTDELLDLMSRRDTARQFHSTPSPSSHPHSPPPHSGDGRGAGHFALTPTPRSVSESTTNDDAEIVVVDRCHSDGLSTALEDLLGFMQWFVDGDLGALQQDSEFKDKFGDWVRAHIPPPSTRPHTSHHTRPRDDEQERGRKLEENVRDLQQQLDNVATISQQKDAEITQLKGQLRQTQANCNALTQHLEESRTKLLEEVSEHKKSREELRHQLREATSLHESIATLKEENASLRTTLDQAPPTTHLETLKQQIQSLVVEKDDLRAELEAAAERGVAEADTMTQLHQLAVMLQESHRSLVATNSHLLQDLEESKLRHSQELSQMNMNYNTLRKTIDLYAET